MIRNSWLEIAILLPLRFDSIHARYNRIIPRVAASVAPNFDDSGDPTTGAAVYPRACIGTTWSGAVFSPPSANVDYAAAWFYTLSCADHQPRKPPNRKTDRARTRIAALRHAAAVRVVGERLAAAGIVDRNNRARRIHT